jgi:hypothetical protein
MFVGIRLRHSPGRIPAQTSKIELTKVIRREEDATHVQSAYRNPQKQNAAIIIKTRNCIIMARKLRTIKLFFRVTKASLHDGEHGV